MELTYQEASDFFAELFYGEHHIPSKIKRYGPGWSVSVLGDVSTHDFSQLTRLVVLAHDRCMRASITSGGPRRICIAIHKRDPEKKDSTMLGHPKLEEHIVKIRSGLK